MKATTDYDVTITFRVRVKSDKALDKILDRMEDAVGDRLIARDGSVFSAEWGEAER